MIKTEWERRIILVQFSISTSKLIFFLRRLWTELFTEAIILRSLHSPKCILAIFLSRFGAVVIMKMFLTLSL